MDKFLFSIVIIFVGLIVGYLIQIFIFDKPIIKNNLNKKKLIRTFQKIALLVLNPIALIGALWQVNLNAIELVAMPFFGMSAIALGGILVYIFTKIKKVPRKSAGSLVISGAFTNIGNIGGLICFIYLGEIGYALVPLYKLFEELIYYGVGFPIAKSYGDDRTKNENVIKRVFGDIFIVVALLSVATGLSLSASGLDRPFFYSSLNQFIIPISTLLLLMSIGMNFKFSSIKKNLSLSLVVVFVKGLIAPIIVTSAAFMLGMHHYNDGLALKVILILSSMPSGFLSLVPPALYNLDIDLANTTWLMTTLSLLWIVPLLGFVLPLI